MGHNALGVPVLTVPTDFDIGMWGLEGEAVFTPGGFRGGSLTSSQGQQPLDQQKQHCGPRSVRVGGFEGVAPQISQFDVAPTVGALLQTGAAEAPGSVALTTHGHRQAAAACRPGLICEGVERHP
ncbi:hypothetical protein EYF80_001239 [Liparis tanakae]|uniref:Uncharacterized protein n=1 Tax=Liparis tanakae TaxID=230148 RepID=A0A4Z2JER4_9TELE|nr:hypothetical protein EYF80_001239 [Liparis tanakae]